MTATYNATGYPYNPIPTGHGINVESVLLNATVTCAAAPTTADTINYGYLPTNAVVTQAFLKSSDMDSNVSPTITLDVGIGTSAQLFFAASTAAQAGTVDNSLATAGRLYQNTTGAKLPIVGTAHANAATGASGTLQLVMIGYIADPTTSG